MSSPSHHNPQAAAPTRHRPVRRRVTGAVLASLGTGAIAIATMAGASPSASAHHLAGKNGSQAGLASYQQFALCMRSHGIVSWPDADPAHPSVFAVTPQTAGGDKQRLGEIATTCSTIVGNGDVSIVR